MLRGLVCVIALLGGSGCVRVLESTAPPAAGSELGPAADGHLVEASGAQDRSALERALNDAAHRSELGVPTAERASSKDGSRPPPDAGGFCKTASNWVCMPQGMGCTSNCGNAVVICTLGMSAKCTCQIGDATPIPCSAASFQFDCPPCNDVVAANCCKL